MSILPGVKIILPFISPELLIHFSSFSVLAFFSYDVTTRLLSAMLWNILTPRAGPSLQPHHMLMNQCKQLENKLAAATCFKPLVHLLWNLASTFMSWLWKHWATHMVLSYNWKPPHHTSVPHYALLTGGRAEMIRWLIV